MAQVTETPNRSSEGAIGIQTFWHLTISKNISQISSSLNTEDILMF